MALPSDLMVKAMECILHQDGRAAVAAAAVVAKAASEHPSSNSVFTSYVPGE